MSLDNELPLNLQWHRDLNFTNVFRGTINSDNTVVGNEPMSHAAPPRIAAR